MPSLADRAAVDPNITGILINRDITNTEAARRIGDTSETSVRRYRASNGCKPTPAPAAEAVSKDNMPTYQEYEGPNGRAALHLPRADYTEEDLLRQAGFDPDSWYIKGHVNTRRWMRYDQEWLFYYKFDAEQGESHRSAMAHVEDLVQRIRKRSPRQPKFTGYVHGGTYVHLISDWQIGKREGNRGTPQTVARYKDCLAQAVETIVRLRKAGVVIDRLAIVSVGDLVEGCDGHYDMQTFSVDLDRRSQNRVVRELLTETILTLAPMFSEIMIAGIGGNHGEHRKKGKAFTTFADNDDVACIEAVKEAFDLAGWDHLEWVIPDEDLSICVDLGGVKVGLVHGHQFKGGVNALKKAEEWWRASDFGLQAVREAQILLSGHFHHFCAVNIAHGRTWIQGPTIDPGSKWYTDTSGVTAIPGVLNMVVTLDSPVGYDHLRVLHPADDEPSFG